LAEPSTTTSSSSLPPVGAGVHELRWQYEAVLHRLPVHREEQPGDAGGFGLATGEADSSRVGAIDFIFQNSGSLVLDSLEVV